MLGLLSAGIAVAAALIALSLALSHDAASARRRLYALLRGTTGEPVRQVVVADIENRTGEAVLDHTIRELLAATLEQSSVLKVFPAAELSEALRRMAKPQTADIGAQLAIDLCQKEGLHAAIVGSVARIGSEYVIILRALDARGEIITSVSEHKSILAWTSIRQLSR